MRTFLGHLRSFPKCLLPAVTLALLLGSTICRGQGDCDTSSPSPLVITSITPNVWHAGQTYDVVATGNFDLNSGCVYAYVLVGETVEPLEGSGVSVENADPNIDVTNVNAVSATQTSFTVTVGAGAPSGTEYVQVECADCDYNPVGTVQIVNSGPIITKITPAAWWAGREQKITIEGTGFLTKSDSGGPTQLSVSAGAGSVQLTNVKVVSATEITARGEPAAADPTGTATITATNPPNGGSPGSGSGTATILPIPTIVWSNNPNTPDDLIAGPDLPPQTRSAAIGQQIGLTSNLPSSPATLPGNIAFQSKWVVGGTNIGGYPNSNESASVTNTVLDGPSTTFYWVYPKNDTVSVKYRYCVDVPDLIDKCSPDATARFNVMGPGIGRMRVRLYNHLRVVDLGACVRGNTTIPAGPWLMFGSANGGTCTKPTGGIPGILFYQPEGYSGDPDGIFSVVQLINSDEINGDTQASFADVLDSEDPYGEFPAAINDSPLVNLLPTYRFVRRTMKATDFLMWQPPPPSIPVPLGYLQWEFSGSATCSRFCGEARNWKANTEFISGDGMPGLLKSFTKSAPSQMSIDNITLEFGIPTWEGSTDE